MKHEHYHQLRQGVEAWNAWRLEHPDEDIDLTEADIRGIDLSGVKPSDQSLNPYLDPISRDMSLSNLRIGVDLRFANLAGAKLCNANLRGADFRDAVLDNADFSGANLGDMYHDSDEPMMSQGAKFSNAFIEGTNFSSADLSDADLGLSWIIRANFSNANLSFAKLHRADLTDSNLEGVNFCGVSLKDGNLSGVDLCGANLSQSNFEGTDLSGANLDNTSFYLSNLQGAKLTRASLKGASLSGSNLCGADLNDANLYEANLDSANLCGVQALGSQFNHAILTGACVDGWMINQQTQLTDVVCNFIHLRYDWHKKQFTERRPRDYNRPFAADEFKALVQFPPIILDWGFVEIHLFIRNRYLLFLIDSGGKNTMSGTKQ
ncbi:pentapeptide repeat-containing protein [Nodularia sp. UHCC 0506]|uniref:pentapeptide repeat-containing protein n=1 Tax=Nodularia sp. UHCC 0506 TaxID=3110243 RepID=UPI002B1EEA28|nr:pentapeptide repeat-containing protein [Nodularia sp. UHCC 0506]MEA5515177.1 pentapeptide repeat-containing protein [Nodularia sp. UHCC 0506]